MCNPFQAAGYATLHQRQRRWLLLQLGALQRDSEHVAGL